MIAETNVSNNERCSVNRKRLQWGMEAIVANSMGWEIVVKAKLRNHKRRSKMRNGCIKGIKQQCLIKEKMNEYRKKTNQQKKIKWKVDSTQSLWVKKWASSNSMETDALQETIFQSIPPGPRTIIAKATRDHIVPRNISKIALAIAHFSWRELGLPIVLFLSIVTSDLMNENGRLHDIFSVSGPHFPAFSFVSLIFILDIIIKIETTKIGFDFVELCWKIVKDRQIAERGVHMRKCVSMKVHMVMSYSWKTT